MDNLSSKCILCGENRFRIVGRRGILRKSGPILDFSNVVCKNCGLVFLNPQPSKEDYRKIYQKFENSKFNYKDESEVTRMMDFKNNIKGDQIFNFLKEYLRNGKEILDIGCGFGHISYSLKTVYSCNVFAIEPSELLAKKVGERLGINVFNGQLDDFIPKSDKKFNVLIMHHVFEHFIDPIKKLNQFKDLLLSDGVVYIEIPDVLFFNKPVSQFFDYMHPFNYSPKTFKELVYKNGYKIIKVNKEKKYRIQAVIASRDSKYPDIGEDDYWKRGEYWDVIRFIKKRRMIDWLKKIKSFII